jgi:hypothetical protein
VRVFISWSGERSRRVALVLRAWLPSVLQAVIPFMSEEDIPKGAQWLSTLNVELARSSFGIVCLTAENRESPWLNFEAGAIANAIGGARLCPLLLNLRSRDVQTPISIFQMTQVTETDLWKLTRSLNELLEQKLGEEQLRRTYLRWLPDLLAGIEHALATEEQEMPHRDTSDLVQDMLQEVRMQSGVVTQILAILSTETRTRVPAEPSDADRVFDQYKIDDNDEGWGLGELNVQIVHRGRIRVNRTQWQQIIDTCSDGFVEDGIRKDFYFNIFQHPSGVRLTYVTYRYKQSEDTQKELRRGILTDEETNISEAMMHLAFWFTAQPHAEKHYPVWKKLVDEAIKKLREVNE